MGSALWFAFGVENAGDGLGGRAEEVQLRTVGCRAGLEVGVADAAEGLAIVGEKRHADITAEQLAAGAVRGTRIPRRIGGDERAVDHGQFAETAQETNRAHIVGLQCALLVEEVDRNEKTVLQPEHGRDAMRCPVVHVLDRSQRSLAQQDAEQLAFGGGRCPLMPGRVRV